MSKRILFLYSLPKQKSELLRCEAVFKAVLRKFRKSVIFSYLQIDTSPTCREKMEEFLKSSIKISDAVIFCGDARSFSQDSIFIKEVFGAVTEEKFLAGRCICSPLCDESSHIENDTITEKSVCSLSQIKKAVSLAVSTTKRKKHNLTVCTQSESSVSNLLFREFEYALGKEKHISISHIDFDEMLLCSMGHYPFPDVILTTHSISKTVSLLLSSMQKMPTGYTCWHTDSIKIYRREIFHLEQTSCAADASLLLLFSAVLKNELFLEGAGDWLKRSVCVAYENNTQGKEFMDNVIYEINKPMRNRKEKQNVSEN